MKLSFILFGLVGLLGILAAPLQAEEAACDKLLIESSHFKKITPDLRDLLLNSDDQKTIRFQILLETSVEYDEQRRLEVLDELGALGIKLITGSQVILVVEASKTDLFRAAQHSVVKYLRAEAPMWSW